MALRPQGLPNAVLATRECGNSRDSSLGRCIEVIQTVTDPLTRISVAIQHGRSPEAMNSWPRGQLASVSSTQSNRLMSLKDEIPPAEVSPSQVSRYFDYPLLTLPIPRRCQAYLYKWGFRSLQPSASVSLHPIVRYYSTFHPTAPSSSPNVVSGSHRDP
jgi:hypothetical protein